MTWISVVLMLGFAASVSVVGGPAATTRMIAVEGGRAYSEISPTMLNAIMARKDFLLVNVHVPYDGEIVGTDRFIPFDEITAGRVTLQVRKDTKVVLYCRSGPMSAIAARALLKAGYTNVSILAGGMSAWEDAGLPITRRAR